MDGQGHLLHGHGWIMDIPNGPSKGCGSENASKGKQTFPQLFFMCFIQFYFSYPIATYKSRKMSGQ